MRVRVLLFARAREDTGRDVLELELPDGSDVHELREAIQRQQPALGGVLRHAVFAVNRRYAAEEQRLVADDEIACIPPVSGG